MLRWVLAATSTTLYLLHLVRSMTTVHNRRTAQRWISWYPTQRSVHSPPPVLYLITVTLRTKSSLHWKYKIPFILKSLTKPLFCRYIQNGKCCKLHREILDRLTKCSLVYFKQDFFEYFICFSRWEQLVKLMWGELGQVIGCFHQLPQIKRLTVGKVCTISVF